MAGSEQKLLVTGIYTLTPTHCGTGQAAGAVDLPIAREAHTGLPLIPASSLKGIARDDWFRLPGDREDWTKAHSETYEQVVKPLFGPLPPRRRKGESDDDQTRRQKQGEREASEDLAAGDLVFIDALLLAFPVRSLTGGFRLATSPLLLHRLRRVVRALDAEAHGSLECPVPGEGEALLPRGQSGPLSLEDLVFARDRCKESQAVNTLGEALGRLVAEDSQDPDRVALPERLVVLPDAVLQDLTRRGTTVSARIKLLPNKTSENLWYEESLPPDCLFAAVIAARPGATASPIGSISHERLGHQRYTQIGGNATVGHGQCRWVLRPSPGVLA